MPIPLKNTHHTAIADPLYGSGLTWQPGEVKEVSEAVAVNLLRHPEFEDARKKKAPIEVPPVELKDEPEEEVAAPLVSLDAMTKDQIAQYAHRNFGVVLESGMKKADMVDAVRRQMGKRGA